jgi:hypothetical protein
MTLRFGFVTDDSSKSPILEEFVLRFMLRPDVKWGWNFAVVCATNYEYGGRSDDRLAKDIIADLRTLFRSLAQSRRVVAVSMAAWSPRLDTDGRSRALSMDLLGVLLGV